MFSGKGFKTGRNAPRACCGQWWPRITACSQGGINCGKSKQSGKEKAVCVRSDRGLLKLNHAVVNFSLDGVAFAHRHQMSLALREVVTAPLFVILSEIDALKFPGVLRTKNFRHLGKECVMPKLRPSFRLSELIRSTSFKEVIEKVEVSPRMVWRTPCCT